MLDQSFIMVSICSLPWIRWCFSNQHVAIKWIKCLVIACMMMMMIHFSQTKPFLIMNVPPSLPDLNSPCKEIWRRFACSALCWKASSTKSSDRDKSCIVLGNRCKADTMASGPIDRYLPIFSINTLISDILGQLVLCYSLELLPFFKFRLRSDQVASASSSSIMRCLRRPRTLVLVDFFCSVSKAHTENVADSSYIARNDGRLVSNKWKNLYNIHDQ